MITYGAISLILFGNAFYAYRCIFRTREYIDQYGFGDGSAIMTRLVGTFAAGFAIVLAVALATSIEGAWLLFVYGFIQAIIGALVCYRTINSHWGAVDGVKTSAEGYLAPIAIAVLNMIVLISGRESLFRGLIKLRAAQPFVRIPSSLIGRLSANPVSLHCVQGSINSSAPIAHTGCASSVRMMIG